MHKAKEERISEGLLKIGEIAAKSDVLVSTVRHYTDIGLLKSSEATQGGHRLYKEKETLMMLARIKRYIDRGKSLPQIKEEIALSKKIKKILVVDDEVEVGDFIKDALKDWVTTDLKVALDGFTAGRILSEFFPELIILDLNLPGVDGFQVCRQIRKEPLQGDVKILAITGYDSPEARRLIFECGADDYLPKPMDLQVLRSKISQLLNIKLPSKATLSENPESYSNTTATQEEAD